MISNLKLEIRVALYTLHEIFGSEMIVGGSVADFLNICEDTQYFFPSDIDITITPDQLDQLRHYFYAREVEGLYRQNVVSEYYLTISGCSVDVFVKESAMKDEETAIYTQGDWEIRHHSIKERVEMCNTALQLPISDFRKRKHMNRLTFYRIAGCI